MASSGGRGKLSSLSEPRKHKPPRVLSQETQRRTKPFDCKAKRRARTGTRLCQEMEMSLVRAPTHSFWAISIVFNIYVKEKHGHLSTSTTASGVNEKSCPCSSHEMT